MRTFKTSISLSILPLFSRVDLGSRCRFAMRCLSNPFATFKARESAVLWCSSFSWRSSRFRLGILSGNLCLVVSGPSCTFRRMAQRCVGAACEMLKLLAAKFLKIIAASLIC